MKLSSILLLGLFFLSNASAQQYHWRHALSGSFESVAFNPLSKGRIIYAGGDGTIDGIFRSDDGGLTWKHFNTDTLHIPMNFIHQVFCVPADTSVLLAVSPNRLYRSTDGGVDWYIVNDSIGGLDGEDIAWHASDSSLYYGETFGVALWKSKDDGTTWFQTGFANRDSIGLCALDVSSDVRPTIIQGSEDSGILARSVDDAGHWQVTLHPDTGTNNKAEVPKVVFSKYAVDPSNGRHDVALAIRWLSKYRSLVGSVDGGLTWRILPFPSSYPWSMDFDQRAAMISKPTDAAYPFPLHYFIGLFGIESDTAPNGMVQETTDGGMTWRGMNFPKGSGVDPSNPLVNYVWVLKYDTTTGRIAAATDSGVYIADTIESGVAEEPFQDSSFTFERTSNGFLARSDIPLQNATIYDILGRTVWSSNFSNKDEFSFSWNDEEKGFFFIALQYWNGRIETKPIWIY